MRVRIVHEQLSSIFSRCFHCTIHGRLSHSMNRVHTEMLEMQSMQNHELFPHGKRQPCGQMNQVQFYCFGILSTIYQIFAMYLLLLIPNLDLPMLQLQSHLRYIFQEDQVSHQTCRILHKILLQHEMDHYAIHFRHTQLIWGTIARHCTGRQHTRHVRFVHQRDESIQFQ